VERKTKAKRGGRENILIKFEIALEMLASGEEK
jgi:hypothetical protein